MCLCKSILLSRADIIYQTFYSSLPFLFLTLSISSSQHNYLINLTGRKTWIYLWILSPSTMHTTVLAYYHVSKIILSSVYYTCAIEFREISAQPRISFNVCCSKLLRVSVLNRCISSLHPCAFAFVLLQSQKYSELGGGLQGWFSPKNITKLNEHVGIHVY